MKDGSIWVGSFMGVLNAAMRPIVETRERTTIKRGKTTPVTRRNIMNSNIAIVTKESSKNLRTSFIIDCFIKWVTDGIPAI